MKFSAYAVNLAEDLQRCFGAKITDLLRATSNYDGGHVTVAGDSSSWKVEVNLGSTDPTAAAVAAPDPVRLLPRYLQRYSGAELARVAAQPDELAADEIAEGLAWLAFEDSPDESWYLPAARSGILQSHKLIAHSLIRRSSGGRDSARPALPGVVTDFLSEMVTLGETEDGDFQDAARELEQNILNGEVRVVPVPLAAPEIRYRTASTELPLPRTSSMVSEVAPVALYLRHLLHKHDLLVVEEPEAHLHPASQAAFARVVCELVNADLSILLTTHSEFFLKQINNLVSASAASNEALSLAGIRQNSIISPEDVAAYFFSPTGEDGTEVAELKVDSDSGISDSTFFEVAEALYDQSMTLYHDRPE